MKQLRPVMIICLISGVVLTFLGITFNLPVSVHAEDELYNLESTGQNNLPEYIVEIQRIGVGGKEWWLMAKTTKDLNENEFISAVSELVKNGIVYNNQRNTGYSIKERKVVNDSEYIIIQDRGTEVIANDCPGTGWVSVLREITLSYKYRKSDRKIFFDVFRKDILKR